MSVFFLLLPLPPWPPRLYFGEAFIGLFRAFRVGSQHLVALFYSLK